MENGVEVVDNGSGIHPVDGEPRALSLEEEFRIDLEDPALAEAGLTDVTKIDLDSKGRIYVFRRFHQGQGPLVYKFDERGRFLKSFISLGQGPGEVDAPFYWPISAAEEIRIYERREQHVVSYYDLDGRFLRRDSKQGKGDLGISGINVKPLANGNILARRLIFEEKTLRILGFALSLFDSDFRWIKDIREVEPIDDLGKVKDPYLRWIINGSTESRFFVNWGASGRDIAVFDLDGKLLRLIRGSFPLRPMSRRDKDRMIESVPDSGKEVAREVFEALKTFPPFLSFLSDDRGRLIVVRPDTIGADEASVCEFFTEDGVRFLRTGLGFVRFSLFGEGSVEYVFVIKNGRACCLREKPGGFKEIVVYAMRWS